MSELVPDGDWAARALAENPLKFLPAAYRPSVAKLWACNAHLFASVLPIASTVRVYLDTETVTPDELARIVARLLRPEKRATHRFAADVLTDLSALVAEVVRTRKARAETEARRAMFGGIDAANLFPRPGD